MRTSLFITPGEKDIMKILSSDTDFSSYNLPDAIFSNDTITGSDFITQKWLKNDFYGFTYSLNIQETRLNAVLGGGWNRYKGNHFGDIIWAKIVTFDDEFIPLVSGHRR